MSSADRHGMVVTVDRVRVADPIEVRKFTRAACCCRKSAKLVSSGCLQQIEISDIHCERISVMGSSKPSIVDESTKLVIAITRTLQSKYSTLLLLCAYPPLP